VESQRLLGSYLTLINRHDFHGVRPLYSRKLARGLTEDQDRRSHQTSFFFNAKITEVTRNDADGADVRLTMMVLFAPNSKGAEGRACSRLDYRYHLVRESGRLRIDPTEAMAPAESCDTE
jgi:hypothetical protein